MKASLKFLLHNTSPSILVALALGGLTVSAQQPHVAQLGQGFRCAARGNVFEVSAYATGILRVAVQAGGVGDGRTPVLDPAMHETSAQGLSLSANGSSEHIRTQKLQADFDCASDKLEVSDGEGHAIVSATGLGPAAAHQSLALHRSAADPMYGMAGLGRRELHGALERSTGAVVHAGTQGDGGAPFFFTKSFGLLIDSIDGKFEANGLDVTFTEGSRTELEFFVFVGPPLSTMSGLADLTGHAPMPPRWTLGFLNSQWGIDEEELKTLVGHYRASHIPLDGFILDYDWKAWGEDHFGEWRWNSTSGAGNDQPDRFPDGASGALGREMKARGVHLAGILKPRILLYKAGTSEFTDEAAYADAHQFWLPGEGRMEDMGTHRPAQDIDFAQPAAREWFWKHLEPAFDAGMAGWWNDEADEAPLADKSTFHTNSMEFFSMGRALYEGQRGHSQARVWSLNRNFYLGAQRFGYAEWSGDIATGAETMAAQPVGCWRR